ncbi:hypothetical protein TRVL_08919 [Trypanosoma vivax]|nr:hypothetical protein TRVL_08919 [Trypanosoma vivax]
MVWNSNLQGMVATASIRMKTSCLGMMKRGASDYLMWKWTGAVRDRPKWKCLARFFSRGRCVRCCPCLVTLTVAIAFIIWTAKALVERAGTQVDNNLIFL